MNVNRKALQQGANHSLHSRTGRRDLTENILKQQAPFRLMTKVNLYQNEKSMRGKEEDDDSKRTRSSVKHDGAKVMACAYIAAGRTGSLVFIDHVSAIGSSRMNYKVHRALLSAQIQPNAAKLISLHFTEQMSNDPKHAAKETQEVVKGKKWKLLNWSRQPPELNPKESFSVIKCKTEDSEAHKQATTEGGCCKGLTELRKYSSRY